MTRLILDEVIRPATALDEDVRIIVRTEDHDTAVSLLKETNLKATCQVGNMGQDPDLQLATGYARKALEAAVQSEVEFDSVAPPESL